MEHKTDRTENYRYEIQFSDTLIELDVYRLLTIIYSSQTLHTADPPIFGFPMSAWRFERAEIYRIIFMLAIKARNIIDKSNTEIKKVADGIVGELEEKDANSELSFREACNKIIHSEHIDFGIINFNPKDEVVHDGLTEFVYVYGSKGKQEWKATINLIQFSDKTMRILL